MDLDPWPYLAPAGSRHAFPGTLHHERLEFAPREGYEQNRTLYPFEDE
jgi:hypothetical protein